MSSARRLSWLASALAALTSAALGLATAIAVSRAEVSVPAPGQLAAACSQLLPSASGAAVLALLALAGTVLARAIRSARRALLAQRHLRRELRVVRMARLDGVGYHVISGEAPHAFCCGLLTPLIYVTEGALGTLGERELRAVLAHEDHHRRRRDPLRLTIGAVIADALFFVPALARLNERYAAIAELAADEAAVQSADRAALASALLRFTAPQPAAAVGVAPERVDHLLGRPATWDLPLLAGLGALLALGLLAAVGVAVAARATTVNVAMALMGSCMLVMTLAGIGALAGIVAVCRRQA
ncbi:MAG: M56 family metallopeptidase [Solirubrobacteraceae bacterium]